MRPITRGRWNIARIVLSCITLLALSARAQPQPVSELRFPVALQLSGSWCYGYLSASEDRIRFEVVQPQADHNYSFEAPRADEFWVRAACSRCPGSRLRSARISARSSSACPGCRIRNPRSTADQRSSGQYLVLLARWREPGRMVRLLPILRP